MHRAETGPTDLTKRAASASVAAQHSRGIDPGLRRRPHPRHQAPGAISTARACALRGRATGVTQQHVAGGVRDIELVAARGLGLAIDGSLYAEGEGLLRAHRRRERIDDVHSRGAARGHGLQVSGRPRLRLLSFRPCHGLPHHGRKREWRTVHRNTSRVAELHRAST